VDAGAGHGSQAQRRGRGAVRGQPVRACVLWVVRAKGAVRSLRYALGGFNGTARQKSVERLDPRCGRWAEVRDMHTGRSNFGVEAVGNKVYVAGGFDGHSTVASVEALDVRAARWEPCAPLTTHRSALCCVLLGQDDSTGAGQLLDAFVRLPRLLPAARLKSLQRRLESAERPAAADA